MLGLAGSIARMAQDRKGRKLARYLELLQQVSLDDDALDELEGIGHVLGKSPDVMDRERGAVPQIEGFLGIIKEKDALLGESCAATAEELRSMEKTRIAVAKLWEEHKKVSDRAAELASEVGQGRTARQELRRLLDQHPDLKPLCPGAYWPPLIVRVAEPPAVRTGTLAEVTGLDGPAAAQKPADGPEARNAAPDAPAAPEPAQAPPEALPAEKPDTTPAPQQLGWDRPGGPSGSFPQPAFPHDPGDKRRRKH